MCRICKDIESSKDIDSVFELKRIEIAVRSGAETVEHFKKIMDVILNTKMKKRDKEAEKTFEEKKKKS